MSLHKIKTGKNKYRFYTDKQIETFGYFVASAILLLALIVGQLIK